MSSAKRVKDEVQEVEEDDPPPKSLIRHIISQLRVGMDLSKVTLPTFVLEPRSLLEKLTDFLTHGHLLTEVTNLDDPLERILQVTKWYLSGYHVKVKGVKKPYNPIIGEVFECSYFLPDGSETTYFAEQVSHHPPISAFYVRNKKKNIVVNGHYHPKSRFLGNSAASLGDGECRIEFLEKKETYRCTWPNVYARGILFGRFLMEMGGDVVIECPETGYFTKLEFKTKGFFGGEYNVIEAKIRHKDSKKTTLLRVNGKWNTTMFITDERVEEGEAETKLFFEPSECEVTEKYLPPDEEQPELSSRKIWAEVTEAIRAKDLDKATEEKSKIEEEQRALRKERSKAKIEWEPKFFHPVDKNIWEYNECDRTLYDGSEEEKESKTENE